MKSHTKLLIALSLGIVFGILLHPISDNSTLVWWNTHILASVGQIFLRLIFMAVVPLVFSALILGVVELAEARGLGRVARRTLLFTLLASSFSVLLGVGLVNVLKPGHNLSDAVKAQVPSGSTLISIQESASQSKTWSQALVELIPKNPVEAASKALSGEIIALMVFALIFGIAITETQNLSRNRGLILGFLDEVYKASMKIIEYAMRLAPAGVFCLVFGSVFRFGSELLTSLAAYVGVVILGLLLQQFVVYAGLLKMFTQRSPWTFFKQCREVYVQAFSTASSNATLPKTLDLAERELKLSPQVSRFVLTVGSTANQNGTALFEGVTVLFLAQVYGIDLGLTQQLQVVLMSILAGVGTAGVPGGSLPLVLIVMQSVGIPAEGLGIILGVDRFLDMCRTTLNVSGDLVIAAIVDSNPADNRPQG